MALNVVRFRHEDTVRWGVAREGVVRPVPGVFETTGDFLRGVSLADLAGLAGPDLPESSLEILSPVTRNQQFICQGANYRSHMLESGIDPDEKGFNMIFRKASSCIVPATSDVVRPSRVRLLDYEIELGLVLGADVTGPRELSDRDLASVVAGIVIVNDYSARDVQIPETQFYKGKSFRTFGPVGPYLCLLSPGDFPRLSDLRLTLTVNGEPRQSASTSELVFGPAATITELSSVQDLFVGDLIATGTPAGCALRVPSPTMRRIGGLLSDSTRFRIFVKGQEKRREYLRPGDVVESRIQSADGSIDLGVQRNRIVAAERAS